MMHVYKQDVMYYVVALRRLHQTTAEWKSNKYYTLLFVFSRVGACVHVCALGRRFVALIIQYATRRLTVIRGLAGSTTFFHIASNGSILRKRKLLNINCVFWCSMQLLSKTFLILGRPARYCHKCEKSWYKVAYPLFLSDFNKTRIFLTTFWKPKYQI
jgi:hypothetical protein